MLDGLGDILFSPVKVKTLLTYRIDAYYAATPKPSVLLTLLK